MRIMERTRKRFPRWKFKLVLLLRRRRLQSYRSALLRLKSFL
jgi:hypothetical protein